MIESIYNILSNNAAVSAIVGTRIYPMRLPINTAYPAITYQLVSDVPENSKTGRAIYYNARVQVNCFARDITGKSGVKGAQELQRAVLSALERITPGVYGGILVINSTHLGTMQRLDDFGDYDGVNFFIVEFNICHGSTS